MNKKKSFRVRLTVALVLVGVVLFCPYKSTTAPAWRLQIVDEDGKPISALQVQQHWAYFGIDVEPWIEIRNTDDQGRVAFPRRTTWASLARRALTPNGTDGATVVSPALVIIGCDARLREAKLFWDGRRFWNPSVHEGESRLVAKKVDECTTI